MPESNGSPAAADTVLRDCASRIEGSQLEFRPKSDVRLGPVVFYGLRNATHQAPSEFTTERGLSPAWKAVTEVTANTRATLTIPQAEQSGVALLYANFGKGEGRGWRLTDGSSAVRFEGCPAGEPRFSRRRATVGPRTQFNGGFIIGKAGCYEVEVRVVGRDRTLRRTIGFGTRGQPCLGQ